MKKTEIKEKLNKVIGDMSSRLVLFYKGNKIGTIRPGDTNEETKKSILKKFKIIKHEKGSFSIWFGTPYGCRFYYFDDCKIESI